MIAAKLKLGAVSALVIASVAAPLAIRQHGVHKLREAESALREQADRLAELSAENKRLSERVSAASQSLTGAQLDELLNLRQEIARLRQEAEAAAALRQENHDIRVRLEEQARGPLLTPAEYRDQLSAETVEAMHGIVRELPRVLEQFTRDHPGKLPRSFSELKPYYRDLGIDVGLHSFQFVPDEGLAEPARTSLLLSEVGLRQTPDGRWARVYAFRDGRVIDVVLPGDVSWDSWEEQFATDAAR
jgi:hypothetical protein